MNGEQAKIIKYSGSGAESFTHSGVFLFARMAAIHHS
jgi:hypothetical protein